MSKKFDKIKITESNIPNIDTELEKTCSFL